MRTAEHIVAAPSTADVEQRAGEDGPPTSASPADSPVDYDEPAGEEMDGV